VTPIIVEFALTLFKVITAYGALVIPTAL